MAIIYVVEDDTNIQEIEAIALKNSGHKVYTFDDAAHFYKKIKEKVPDLAILDVMLPDLDGFTLCKRLREQDKSIGIIMLSAKSTDLDKILGLGMGADDYVIKPFNPLELTARVKSQLRRYRDLNPAREQKKEAQEPINNAFAQALAKLDLKE